MGHSLPLATLRGETLAPYPPLPSHSCLIASMGLNLAARRAGYVPNVSPTTIAATAATASVLHDTEAVTNGMSRIITLDRTRTYGPSRTERFQFHFSIGQAW